MATGVEEVGREDERLCSHMYGGPFLVQAETTFQCQCQLTLILKKLIIKMIKISVNNSTMNLMPIWKKAGLCKDYFLCSVPAAVLSKPCTSTTYAYKRNLRTSILCLLVG